VCVRWWLVAQHDDEDCEFVAEFTRDGECFRFPSDCHPHACFANSNSSYMPFHALLTEKTETLLL
jgi:hypothetical protein